MPNHAVGVDISDHTIEVVELAKAGRSAKVVSLGRVKMPLGVVERGRIKNQEKLAGFLKQALREAKPKPISAKEIVFGLPESQVYTQVFDLDPHEKKARENLILQAVTSQVPIKQDQLVHAYKVLKETKEGTSILVVASDREVMLEWKKFFETQKIKIDIFDIETLAVYRDLFETVTETPVCIVDIGSFSTHVGIFDQSGLKFAYSSSIAGAAFTTQLTKSLKIKTSEAVKKKKAGALKSKDKKIVTALAKVADKIIKEIQESLVYFKDKTGVAVGEVVLIGGSSQMKGLLDYFKKTGLPVRLGQSVLVAGAPFDYLEAVGLALRRLYKKWDKQDPVISEPKERKATKKKKVKKQELAVDFDLEQDGGGKSLKKQLIILGIVGILGIGLVSGAFWYRNNQRAEKQAAMEAALVVPEVAIAEEEELPVDVVPPLTVDIIETATTTEAAIITKILVIETGIGTLNVREGAGTSFSIVTKVNVGDEFELLEEESGWSKIKVSEVIQGWVSDDYIEEVVNEVGEES